ncbi:MAG: hypothetical protein AB7F59_01045 [Bdellovibrionales bacterium]
MKQFVLLFVLLGVFESSNAYTGVETLPTRLNCYVGSSFRLDLRISDGNAEIYTGPFGEGVSYKFDKITSSVDITSTDPIFTFIGTDSANNASFEAHLTKQINEQFVRYHGPLKWRPANGAVYNEKITYCRVL